MFLAFLEYEKILRFLQKDNHPSWYIYFFSIFSPSFLYYEPYINLEKLLQTNSTLLNFSWYTMCFYPIRAEPHENIGLHPMVLRSLHAQETKFPFLSLLGAHLWLNHQCSRTTSVQICTSSILFSILNVEGCKKIANIIQLQDATNCFHMYCDQTSFAFVELFGAVGYSGNERNVGCPFLFIILICFKFLLYG